MLSVVNADGTRTPLNIEGSKWYVVHAFNGDDSLEIEIETSSEDYILLQEEVSIYVENLNKIFVVKLVDERKDFATVSAKINLDDWKAVALKNARWTNALVYNIVDAIKPAGWFVVDQARSSQRTTVEYQNGKAWRVVTPLEVLDKCAETYNVVFNFDNVNKYVYIINPDSYTVTDQFFTDEKNLNSLSFSGDSSNYITQLYAYGKIDEETGEALTFASINGGKEFVEDYSYSDKVLIAWWTDERYTVKENLLNDAKKRLREQSTPLRSYSLNVGNLDEAVWLYKKVNLIDRKRKITVVHQVVEYKEYPDAKNKDVVTLSASQPSFANLFTSTVKDIRDSFAQSQTEMSNYIDEQVKKATDMITGNYGGVFTWVLDEQNRLKELVNLGDTTDINSAKKVWRWNASGLGHSNNGYEGPYDLALTADGEINANMITSGVLNANIIRAGILQDLVGNNYWDMEKGEFRLAAQTTVGGKQVDAIAQEKADNAEKNAAADAQKKSDAAKDSAINTAKQNSETIAQNVVSSQTQDFIFNKLTNGGKTQGIYLNEGLLYLNATYLKTGKITDGKGNNTWDLTNSLFTMANGTINLTGPNNTRMVMSATEGFKIYKGSALLAGTLFSGSNVWFFADRLGDQNTYCYVADNPVSDYAGFGYVQNGTPAVNFEPFAVGNVRGGVTVYFNSKRVMSVNTNARSCSFYTPTGTGHYSVLGLNVNGAELANTSYQGRIAIEGNEINLSVQSSTSSSASIQLTRLHLSPTGYVRLDRDSTHYLYMDATNAYIRVGNNGFGWFNGAFSSSLSWDS